MPIVDLSGESDRTEVILDDHGTGLTMSLGEQAIVITTTGRTRAGHHRPHGAIVQ